MPDTSQIVVPQQGMITDISIKGLSPSQYTFALNAVTEGKDGNGNNLQNEMSTHCSIQFPPDYQVVGVKAIPEQHRTLYALVNTKTGGSQIGEIRECNFKDNTDLISKSYCKDCPEFTGKEIEKLEIATEKCYCQYRLIVSDPCLNFNIDYPVDIEYKITDCTLNIYFTDNYNERRYMYFNYSDNNDLQSPLVLDNRFKVSELQVDNTGCTCEDGYIYNDASGKCEKVTVTAITPSADSRVACKAADKSYTNFGVAIYDSFNINGTGVSNVYHTTDTYWSNPSANTTDGVLNRVALWACDTNGNTQAGGMLPFNEYIGFVFPVDLTSTKTYYVGIAGDNLVRIRLDCTTIVDMDPQAVGTQYGSSSSDSAFKYWHIYPVTIPAGHHVIELTGLNYGLVAGFGAEIYDNTKAQLISSTDGSGINVVFSTKNMVGKNLQVSSSFSGTCPSGSCMDVDTNGNLFCTSVDIADPTCGTPCNKTVYLDQLDCDKIKFHANYDRPCITFKGFVNGGNLKEGVYQILLAYADQYGNPISSYFPASQTIPLYNNAIKFETNLSTNKALSFYIDNLKVDAQFQYYNIVIASTIDQFTEFTLVGTFSTTQHNYVYTGFERSPIKLAPTDVLFKRPYYPYAKGVTTANDFLFFNGVREYDLLNLQRVANKINLQWETVALKEKAYNNPSNTYYFHTYQRDEVYAFGIIFEFDNGRDSCVFHIPGRAAKSIDLEVITSADVITELGCNEEVRNLRWQVYNTGSVLGGDHEYNENCEIDNCWEYGEFAYWESTETYPNIPEVWGDLVCLPIRHHKFPDSCVTHIHDGDSTDRPYSQNNYIFPIGVRIDHQSVLTALSQAVTDGVISQKDRDSITGYRIVRGNRVGNKSIDAKGLIFNMWQYNKFSKDYYFANYPYNDLTSDDFLNGVSLTPNRYTFHSPDVHFVNAGLGNILKVETEEYGKSDGYFTHSECQAKYKFLSAFARALAFGLGVAAAYSATGDKQCEVITYKSDIFTDPYSVNSNGTMPFSSVTGVLTLGSGTITTTNIPHSWTGTSDIPKITTEQNNGTYTTYDPDTGLPSGTANAADRQITTCKGQPFQIFNSNTGILAAIGTVIGVFPEIAQRLFLGLHEMQLIVDSMTALIPARNYSIQYNSVGKYNNYSCVAAGNKVRSIDKSAYLNPIIQEVDEVTTDPTTAFTTVNINNWDRESSVYLKLHDDVAAPTHTDNSKVSMSSAGLDYDDLNTHFNRDISSYYVSIKRNVLNQYGQLCNIEYVETSPCTFKLDTVYTLCEAKVFGGDTFINRFALKRKMPFFQHTMCGMPNDSDVSYSDLANVASVKYYFDANETLGDRISGAGDIIGIAGAIIGVENKEWDVSKTNIFSQKGYIHLFNYGIPYFFVESDINVDYRHGQNNKEKGFYPYNADLKEWLEEGNTPIHEDNTYYYNRTYSKQDKESVMCTSCILDVKDLLCQQNIYNKLIYSEPSNTENKNDNWLIFKANNYHNFPLTLGKLISADGIENDKILVRLEKGIQMFPAYNTIQATEQNIQVGTGGMFKSYPQTIAATTLGYAGTQHRDIKHTEFGHIWANAEQGQVFNLGSGGSGMDELTRYGNRNWFKENLPFQIRKDFPAIPSEDIDNNFKGIGLHYCFDKRFNRILITKLDYKAINPLVRYDVATKSFYVLNTDNTHKTVSLKDNKYFCSKSWTASYNFDRKSWTSYHTYKPNFYVEHTEFFESGINGKLYAHNLSNKSYQVVYGKLEPFIVEFIVNNGVKNNIINSIEFNLDVIRYHNEFDAYYDRYTTFNKAIISNSYQTTGILNLIPNNPNQLSLATIYPKLSETGYDILVTNSEDVWRFNNFFDIAANDRNNLPLFLLDCNNVDKKLNTKAIDYKKIDTNKSLIRARANTVRLINDAESNKHFIFTFAQVNSQQSIR